MSQLLSCRSLRVAAIGACFALSGATAASGQTPPPVVGVVGGYVSNEQSWSPDTESEPVGGVVAGAFVRARTPASWLQIHLEGAFTQRGGDVTLDEGGQGAARADYVTVTLLPRAVLGAGPMRVHLATGPTLDLLVESRLDALLTPVLQDGVSAVFGWTLEGGVGGSFGSRGIDVEVAARLVTGLADAYRGDFVTVRNRSTEFVARVGIPLRR